MIITELLFPPEPDGGPQEGVSGEMGKYPGELLPPEPDGGPQEGVSGEIGKYPGESFPPEPDGGPQEGVSGEMGAKPGEPASVICAISVFSETEEETFSPFLSIYIDIPFSLIADANGMMYLMRNMRYRF